MDVDSLFALDPPSVDEISQNTPAPSVFFDSAPTGGRASRFRQLFAQEAPPPQPAPFEANRRPSVDRMNSNPLFNNGPGAGASSEDREGFQRIMAMLGGGGGSGGGGGQTHMSHVPLSWNLTHFSFSETKHLLCNRNLLFTKVKDKVSLRMSFFNVFFDKAKPMPNSLRHLTVPHYP